MADVTVDQQRELLCEYLQMIETIAGVLSFNYLGDGCFKEPAKSPGIAPMVQSVADLLGQAKATAAKIGITAPLITQAHAFAMNLAAQSNEVLHDHRGFRLGDKWIGMCYWTIEKMVNRAYVCVAV